MKTGSSHNYKKYGNLEAPILVETALLGRGLPSLDNNRIADLWPAAPGTALVWLREGCIVFGGMEEFLAVRSHQKWARINSSYLERSVNSGSSGYLTASALLKIASTLGRRVVVTAGMGGVRSGIVSQDLVEIKRGNVLISSSFKDSIDVKASLDYLKQRGVIVAGWRSRTTDGFLFKDSEYELDICYHDVYKNTCLAESTLFDSFGFILFNPLPLTMRLPDRRTMDCAEEQGRAAQARGMDFHPAVNTALDKATGGQSSLLQLQALIDNLHLSLRLTQNESL